MSDLLPIDGTKLIIHNMGVVNNDDDPSFGPFRLDVSLRATWSQVLMTLFTCEHEEIVVRGKTREALEQFVILNDLNGHCRLKVITIWRPEGDANHEQ